MISFLRTSLIAVGYILLAITAFAASNRNYDKSSLSEEFVILDHIVKVTAKVTEANGPSPFDLDLFVRYKNDKFELETSIIAVENIAEAIEQQRKNTGWKGSYLFVRTSCGGGNRWRCSREEIFRIIDGHLIHVGSAFARYDDITGSSFKNGRFLDIYNNFEMNDLTGHAGAPAIWLALYEKGGRFKVDINGTRRKNKSEFKRNRVCIHSSISAKKKVREKDRAHTIEAILHTAILSKYCNKPEYLKEIYEAALTVMDKEQYQIFLEIMSQVVPGELPTE